MLEQKLHYPKDAAVPKGAGPLTAMQEAMRQATGLGAMPWARLPGTTTDLVDIQAHAKRFRESCDHVVLCGTGGSSLGAKALSELVAHPLALPRAGVPQLHILESTDSDLLASLADLPADRTGWIFVSKSGTTLETMTQMLVHLEMTDGTTQAPRLVVTSPGARPMRAVAERYAIPVLEHDPELGGRFSVMSLVGLLPAAILGIDIAAIRRGAATMLEEAGLTLATEAAHWHAACIQSGQGTQIVMPYVARLHSWSLWYRQLWAESLGKQGKGSTPLAALGPVDQHSMLQLFLDGPNDKCLTLVTEKGRGYPSLRVPKELTDFGYLNSHSGAQIVNAQAYGTAQAFMRKSTPMREILLPTLDAESMGALMMLAMLETVFTAQLLGVDAFDQPAVEEGKVTTYAVLKGEKALST